MPPLKVELTLLLPYRGPLRGYWRLAAVDGRYLGLAVGVRNPV